MARTASPAPNLRPPRRADPRPSPISQTAEEVKDGYSPIEEQFAMVPLDQETVAMVPYSYSTNWDQSGSCDWDQGPAAWRCWKTNALYEYMGTTHPQVAEFKGADEWTGLPLFQRPFGPSLDIFLWHHKSLFYVGNESRPDPVYLPLMYQWVVQLLSAIDHLHSRSIKIGHFDLKNCWLSRSLQLSLVGFPSATFHDGRYTVPFPSRSDGWDPFHPLYATQRRQRIQPSIATDLVLFGTFIYELMTTYQPSDVSPDNRVLHEMYLRGEWPSLEERFLGEIAEKCWKNMYSTAQDVRLDLIEILSKEGWEIGADDSLVGFDPAYLLGDNMQSNYPSPER